ncbi:beta-glucuronosyltransferase GlcAT14A [Selaginella moellendorffii]|nr:beta-glucuronosyltransferase GlcAT14A [Selaginella moellendorffii]|eukprot:XP_002960850.2 beta-glucuronosyltransferase GlcAT14A [Selaginella moellendorffii]
MKKPAFNVMERKWLVPLLASSLVSITLFLAATFSVGASSYGARSSVFHLFLKGEDPADMYVESKLSQVPASDLPTAPRLAYLISGTRGDGDRMKRVLQAIYHPRNQYLLHLDLEAPPRERVELARYVKMDPTFTLAGNVHVIGKANLVTYRGSTMIACTLHAAAILLRQSKEWDWFINLSASDYPLVSQDDLLNVFSYLPRDLNFLEHTSDIGWKEFQRAKPIIIDPGLYMNKKTDIFWVTQRRSVPSAFKLFTGSAWVALTRNFTEFCIWGWDNLPRTVLMYYTNFLSSPEGYFHTGITTVNHDLHYITWDNPPKQHPLSLTVKDFDNMNASGSPFGRKFDKDDPVLDMIDSRLLGREKDRFTPGGWCLGSSENGNDPCSVMGDADVLRPSAGAKRLESLVLKLLAPENFRKNQCVH